SALPENGKPLGILLYADKTKLSSFSGQSAYPIMAQCLNLPASTRNGDGPGAGRVVGWLPIIKDDEKEKGKKGYVDWKNAVWHKSFEVLLSSIEKAQDGEDIQCGDGKKRKVFPVILVLSADYEEQCTMALIRGSKGLKPCPICLVPKKHQADHSHRYTLRTTANTVEVLTKARGEQLLGDREKVLKGTGIRNVNNIFWTLNLTNPYRALSFDPLHNYPAGLGGRHIWPDIKHCVEQLGRLNLSLLDNQYVISMPRWPGLYHYDKVVSVEFSDASKWEDLLKVLLFATHNILTKQRTPHGYALLGCLRSYVNLDTYAGMQVHTDETVAAGRLELKRFSRRFREYGAMFGLKPDGIKPVVDVNFPKSHMHAHLFDDIMNKGVTLNYTTKVNERLHGALKDAYHDRTNFRDVEGQILRIDHYLYTARHIRHKIDHLPTPISGTPVTESLPDPLTIPGPGPSESTPSATLSTQPVKPQRKFNHVLLGAPQPLTSFRALQEQATLNDTTFNDLEMRVSRLLTWLLPQNGTPLPDGQTTLKVQPHEKITEHRFLRCLFESSVTWQENKDQLRCNPNFNGRPRHDWVIFRLGQDRIAFGQLKFIFTYKVTHCQLTVPLAIIEAFDVLPPNRIKDKDLELLRLRRSVSARAHIDNIIPLESIIRAAYVVPEFENENEYHVVDVIDDDMFLRLRSLFPTHFPPLPHEPDTEAPIADDEGEVLHSNSIHIVLITILICFKQVQVLNQILKTQTRNPKSNYTL
ncbi:hypothetical protein BDN72DRAFT_938428, partial [Pluteus cervinus]